MSLFYIFPHSLHTHKVAHSSCVYTPKYVCMYFTWTHGRMDAWTMLTPNSMDGSIPSSSLAHAMSGALLTMDKEQFAIEVLKIASQYNPDLVNSTSYEDVLKDLGAMKDKAMRWEIIVSSFKPEPELFPVRQTLADARARQAEQRQGQL